MRNRVFAAARDAVSSDENVFRVNGTKIGLYYCRILLMIALPMVAIAAIIDRLSLIQCLPVLSTLVVGMGVQMLYYAWMEKTFPVRVGNPGITSTDFWGRKLLLTWAEIENVKPARLCGWSFLKVRSFRKDRRVMWVPLFLRSPEAFRAAVAHHASPNNPLRRYLEEESGMQRESLRG